MALKLEAVLSTAGGLALFIPEFGPMLFGAASVSTLLIQLQDAKHQNGDTSQQKFAGVSRIQAELKKFFEGQDQKEAKEFVSLLQDLLSEWVAIEVFRFNDITHLEKMKEVHASLLRYTGEVGDATFRHWIKKLMNGLRWEEVDKQIILLSLFNLYGMCVELLCVLDANLATAYHKQNNSEQSSIWKTAFHDDLHSMRAFFADRVRELEEWMESQSKFRRESLTELDRDQSEEENGDDGFEDNGSAQFSSLITTASFEDNFSKRKWEIRGTETLIGISRDQSDKVKNMVQNASALRHWYEKQLDLHVDHYFDIMTETTKKWKEFAAALTKYLFTIGTKPIDGVALYNQMLGKFDVKA
ncbi:hypothetical protein ABW21_db0203875 [Orbilia brochopaga]|nr:hypothetical protein ABW21_db0203875 [Drechslerella brochopaga]